MLSIEIQITISDGHSLENRIEVYAISPGNGEDLKRDLIAAADRAAKRAHASVVT